VTSLAREDSDADTVELIRKLREYDACDHLVALQRRQDPLGTLPEVLRDGVDAARRTNGRAVWGLPTLPTDLPQATDLVIGRGLQRSGGYVCFCNVHVLVTAQHDEQLRQALVDATLVFADGWPVARLQRAGGAAVAERIAGADLMASVFGAGRSGGLRHFLFGSTPAVLEHLQGRLLRRFPAARIVGAAAPPTVVGVPEDGTCPEAIAAIRETQPHLVWCALGAPKQEVWMHAHVAALAPAVLLGVGAAFEFLAGTKPRAPEFMRHAGLEWLHRMICEPRRLTGRYVTTNAEFISRLLVYSLRRRTAA
jgi:N-acetylglucosaminyldiphosphoundecaprenol N-acetyl-beta-D-mannosaminyltransferase